MIIFSKAKRLEQRMNELEEKQLKDRADAEASVEEIKKSIGEGTPTFSYLDSLMSGFFGGGGSPSANKGLTINDKVKALCEHLGVNVERQTEDKVVVKKIVSKKKGK